MARGRTPLCVGIESGAATGWVFAQWVSGMVLRLVGPEVYDQWVNHEIAFDNERIVRQMQRVLDLRNTEGMVFAAGGSISTTRFDVSAQSLVAGDCLMHLQGSFYSGYFDGVPFADGSADAVDVFRFPSDRGREITGTVTLAGTLADRPEVWAVMGSCQGPNTPTVVRRPRGSAWHRTPTTSPR